MGQVLSCGAIIKSNLYTRGGVSEKKKVIEMLINAGSMRTYLGLASVTFLKELIETVCIYLNAIKKKLFVIVCLARGKSITNRSITIFEKRTH